MDFAWAFLAAMLMSVLEGAGQVGLLAAAPLSIVTVSVYTLAAQLELRWAFAMLAVMLAGYSWGAAELIGWTRASQINDLYRIGLGWTIAVVLRAVVLRLAAAADKSHSDRLAAELLSQVAEARRNFISEQLAVLHDTAAATLLLVGQGSPVASERLAAQSRRDLQILRSAPGPDNDRPMDVVALLRDAAEGAGAPVATTGRRELWLPGELATAVCASAREAVFNAQRHACSGTIRIDIGGQRVVVSDNGPGFAPGTQIGHGITESILGRMNRAGGYATIQTGPNGTTVTIRWPATKPALGQDESASETDRTVARLTAGYRVAFTVLAVTNLIAAVEWAPLAISHRPVQCTLAVLVGLCALSALPGQSGGQRWIAPIAAVCLGLLALAQQADLSASELSTAANWSQLAVGLSLLPHALSWSSRRVAMILIALWTVPAAVALTRAPGWPMSLFLAATVAACLIPQLGVAMFSSLARSVATDANREAQARLRVVSREHVAQAIQREYLERAAAVIDRLIPLLTALSEGHPVTPEMRQRARIESQRLRALFDEAKSINGQLLQHLQRAIRPAQDRGLEVSLHVDDGLPLLTEDAVQSLVNRVIDVLEVAGSHARIVLTSVNDDSVAVSVLGDLTGQDHHQLQADDTMQFVSTDTSTWVTFSARVCRPGSDHRARA